MVSSSTSNFTFDNDCISMLIHTLFVLLPTRCSECQPVKVLGLLTIKLVHDCQTNLCDVTERLYLYSNISHNVRIINLTR